MSRDSIEWITAAPDLLPLVPPAWMRSAMREHREAVQFWRKHCKSTEGWLHDINMGSGTPRIQTISVSGAVPFHRDPDFEKFGYLLILRPAHYLVTGQRRHQKAPQPPGTVICFHQARRNHALVDRAMSAGVARDDGIPRESQQPPRLWIAATMESPYLMSPEECVAAMRQELMNTAWNRTPRLAA